MVALKVGTNFHFRHLKALFILNNSSGPHCVMIPISFNRTSLCYHGILEVGASCGSDTTVCLFFKKRTIMLLSYYLSVSLGHHCGITTEAVRIIIFAVQPTMPTSQPVATHLTTYLLESTLLAIQSHYCSIKQSCRKAPHL